MGWVSSDVRSYDRITLFCFSSGFWPGSVNEYQIHEKLITFNRQQRYARWEIQCYKNKVRGSNSLYLVCSATFLVSYAGPWSGFSFLMFQIWVISTDFQIVTSIKYKYFSTVMFLQLIFQLDILSWPFMGSCLHENILFWDEFSVLCHSRSNFSVWKAWTK